MQQHQKTFYENQNSAVLFAPIYIYLSAIKRYYLALQVYIEVYIVVILLMIETGRYTSVLFCLQFRISIYIYASGPCSCRDLTDETYIFEPYCKSVRLPPPLRRTPAHQLRTRRGSGGRLYYYRVPGKGRLCIPHYSAASLILLLHHSGAKQEI